MRNTLLAVVSAFGLWFAYSLLTASLEPVTASVIGVLGR